MLYIVGDTICADFESVIALTSPLTKNLYSMIPDLQRRSTDDNEGVKKAGKSAHDIRESRRVMANYLS